MSIEAITFDFWGTLFRDANGEARTQTRLDALRRATGAAEEAAREALRVVGREFMYMHIEKQRTGTPDEAVDVVCRELGLPLSDEAAAQLSDIFATAIVKYSPVPIDGAFEAVEAAAARYPVGLISDTGISPGSSLKQLLDRYGFTPFLAVLSFSDEVGVAKPQAPMFERTAAALGVSPAALLHLGDLEPTDIAGVQALGGKGGLYGGVNSRFLEDTEAEYVFKDWREFVALLESDALVAVP